MRSQNIITGILIISSFLLKSCASSYVDEDRQDCSPRLIGKWKLYYIENSIAQLDPYRIKDSTVYTLMNDKFEANGINMPYKYARDCSFIVLEFNDKDRYFKYRLTGNDTLTLINQILPHESYTMRLKRLKD